MSFVLKDQVNKVPPWVGGWANAAVLLVCEVWQVCWILKEFWLCQCFCWVMGFDIKMKCFFCLMVEGVAVSVYYCEIFEFCFWVFSRDVMVSDGTGGFISMIWNSFFEGPIGFIYVISHGVVGWAFPVIDYVSLLSIWNWIFWCMSKDLMVLMPLKKTITLYFARVCL